MKFYQTGVTSSSPSFFLWVAGLDSELPRHSTLGGRDPHGLLRNLKAEVGDEGVLVKAFQRVMNSYAFNDVSMFARNFKVVDFNN